MFPKDCINILPENPNESVWVDTFLLQLVMSCSRDSLGSALVEKYSNEILNLPKMCRHQKLHPRIARKGKIIPRKAFSELEEALRLEISDSTSERLTTLLFDLTFDIERVVCKVCCDEYCSELEEKLQWIDQLQILNNELNPRDIKFNLDFEPEETMGNDCDRYAYVVSKKFAYWYF
jgi:hypothetical protein